MRVRNTPRRSAVTILAVGLLGVCLLSAGTDSSSPDAVPENQVKAAFLLNFPKFVDWPAGSFANDHSPIAICLLGDDPFGEVLDKMVKGEAINGHQIQVRRMHRSPEPGSCQIVYVSPSEHDVSSALGSLGPGVLTVGDGARFLRDGGMISFVVENRRVRFDVNLRAAVNASISISSRLLGVARTVER